MGSGPCSMVGISCTRALLVPIFLEYVQNSLFKINTLFKVRNLKLIETFHRGKRIEF
jgi:hypothetical protein